MNIKNKKQYINGVNHAYILAEYQPNLLKQLLDSKTLNDYFIGLQDGLHIYQQERSKKRLQELNKLQKRNTKNRNLER